MSFMTNSNFETIIHAFDVHSMKCIVFLKWDGGYILTRGFSFLFFFFGVLFLFVCLFGFFFGGGDEGGYGGGVGDRGGGGRGTGLQWLS